MEKQYKFTTQVYTVEDYMDECCMCLQEVHDLYGQYVQGFVWVMLEDESVGYAQRLFGAIYADSLVGHAQAVQTVTLELLQDYFKHIQPKGRPAISSK